MENDPRFFQLLQMAKAYRVPLLGNQQGVPLESRVPLPRVGEGGNSTPLAPTLFSNDQLQQLRAQIMAYKILGRNQAIPDNVLLTATGAERKPLLPTMRADAQLAAGTEQDMKQSSLECKEDVSKVGMGSEKDQEPPPPLNIEKQMLQSRVVDPKQLLKSSQEPPQSKLMPATKLPGLDPTDIIREREHRYHSSVSVLTFSCTDVFERMHPSALQ